MNTKTIEVQGVQITVRESYGMDAIDCNAIFASLSYNRDSKVARRRAAAFADTVLRTVNVEGLPFAWVNAEETDEALQAAFDGWQQLSAGVLARWQDALYSVNDTSPVNEVGEG